MLKVKYSTLLIVLAFIVPTLYIPLNGLSSFGLSYITVTYLFKFFPLTRIRGKNLQIFLSLIFGLVFLQKALKICFGAAQLPLVRIARSSKNANQSVFQCWFYLFNSLISINFLISLLLFLNYFEQNTVEKQWRASSTVSFTGPYSKIFIRVDDT